MIAAPQRLPELQGSFHSLDTQFAPCQDKPALLPDVMKNALIQTEKIAREHRMKAISFLKVADAASAAKCLEVAECLEDAVRQQLMIYIATYDDEHMGSQSPKRRRKSSSVRFSESEEVLGHADADYDRSPITPSTPNPMEVLVIRACKHIPQSVTSVIRC